MKACHSRSLYELHLRAPGVKTLKRPHPLPTGVNARYSSTVWCLP